MFPGVPYDGDILALTQWIDAPAGISDSGKKRRAHSLRTTVNGRATPTRHSAFTRLTPYTAIPSTRQPIAVAFTMSGRSGMSVLEDSTPLAIHTCDDRWFAVRDETTVIEPDQAGAPSLEKVEVVRHEHCRHATSQERRDARETLLHE